jgi:hypothetical protein
MMVSLDNENSYEIVDTMMNLIRTAKCFDTKPNEIYLK